MKDDALKQLAEHLRATLFVLLLALSTALLALMFADDSEVTKARKDLLKLIEIRRFYQADWLNQRVRVMTDGRATPVGWTDGKPAIPGSLKIPEQNIHVGFEMEKPFHVLAQSSNALFNYLSKQREGSRWLGERRPANTDYVEDRYRLDWVDTVGGIRRLWDSLADDARLLPMEIGGTSASVQISEAFRDLTHDAKNYKVRMVHDQGEAPHLMMPLFLEAVPPASISPVTPPGSHTFHGHLYVDEAGRIPDRRSGTRPLRRAVSVDLPAAPLAEEGIRIDLQRELKDSLGRDIPTGTFDYAFESLSEVSRGLENLPLDDLLAVLDSDYLTRNKKVSILDIELPLQEVSRMGLFLICLIQLYLLAHFRYFASSYMVYGEGCFIPWTVLYPGWLAMAINLISLLVLPLLFVGISLSQIEWGIRAWPLLGGAVFCLVLSLANSLVYLKVRRAALRFTTSR